MRWRISRSVHRMPLRTSVVRGRCAEDGCNALIISAEGGREHFPGVRRWVASAPVIDGRHGIVLKPARGFDFGLDYEDVTLGPEATWFVPLRSRHDPGMG
jgi:hypothetical protein